MPKKKPSRTTLQSQPADRPSKWEYEYRRQIRPGLDDAPQGSPERAKALAGPVPTSAYLQQAPGSQYIHSVADLQKAIDEMRTALAVYLSRAEFGGAAEVLGNRPSEFWRDQVWEAYAVARRLNIDHGRVVPSGAMKPREADEWLAHLLASTSAGKSKRHADTPSRLILNDAGDVATLDGKNIAITPDEGRCLKLLLKAKGRPVASKTMKAFPGSSERPDRLVTSLQGKIPGIIKGETGKGYRLTIFDELE